MDSGARALLAGFLTFVVATATVRLLDRSGTGTDALTNGGLTGGAVALGVWSTSGQTQRWGHSVGKYGENQNSSRTPDSGEIVT